MTIFYIFNANTNSFLLHTCLEVELGDVNYANVQLANILPKRFFLSSCTNLLPLKVLKWSTLS